MIGIGCDIVSNKRIIALINKTGDRFLNKLFTQNEIANAPSETSKRYCYFAKRYAGKEAVAKALGTGIGQVAFKDIEILNEENGKPNCKILQTQYSALKIEISLSDEDEYSIAFVIISS